MKRLLFIILFFSISSLILAEEYDFRKAQWGMSREQIKENEISVLIKEEPEYIAYKGNVAELDCLIVYHFLNNKFR